MGLYDRDYMQPEREPRGPRPTLWAAVLMVFTLLGALLYRFLTK